MILQITREINDEMQENLIDGVNDIVTSTNSISFEDKKGGYNSIEFKVGENKIQDIVHIYLLNDEGKTIKRIYNRKK